jgi:hypothetical protein
MHVARSRSIRWPISLAVTLSVACGGGPSPRLEDAPDGAAKGTASNEAGLPDAPSDAPDVRAAGSDGGAATDASTPADASASGDTADGAGSVNGNPTVSSWLGTNVAADLPRVDITYQLTPFDTVASQLDANGYPVAGASGQSSTDIGFILPSGTYKIEYTGTGSLSVSGIGAFGGAWQSVNGEQRNTLQITGTPGSFGNFLTLSIDNGAGQTVQGIHIYYPGFDYDGTTTFLPQFVSILGPFRAMRFMDWESTNGSTLADWADRPAAAHFGQSSFGEPYEHIAELVNETGKDGWLTVPEHATPDFIAQFAAFMAQHLDFARIQAARNQAGFTTPFQLLVEDSNETWNQSFTAYATFLATANADAARYPGTYSGSYGPSWMTQSSDLMKVAEVHADRIVAIGNAFRTAFDAVGHKSAVAPVLSGWALGPGYSDASLTFVQANYGEPKDYVTYVAQAPYFATADDTTTGSLDTLFPAMQSNIASMDATFQDFAMLGTQYGIGIVAYEGGQSLSGTTNQPIKHLAQHDERMYEAYQSYLALWKNDFGESLFMHFSLAGDPGQPENIYQYGFWGSIIGVLEDPATCEANLPTLTGTEAIDTVVHHCPKYRALAEQVP